MTPLNTLRQFLRYGIVGLSSNALLYFVYVGLTEFGMGSKLAMTSLYVLGISQTFIFNKRWTFDHSGSSGKAFRNYALLYVFGYIFNLLVLALCVDLLGWPHQWVMLALLVVMAFFFFVGQKFWVFRPTSVASTGSGEHI